MRDKITPLATLATIFELHFSRPGLRCISTGPTLSHFGSGASPSLASFGDRPLGIKGERSCIKSESKLFLLFYFNQVGVEYNKTKNEEGVA